MDAIDNPFAIGRYVDILSKYGVTSSQRDLFLRWSEPHRVYHTLEHLTKILRQIEFWKSTHPGMSEEEYHAYVLMAFFHDAVYEIKGPAAKENEERSAELFRRYAVDCPPTMFHKVYGAILDTKDHTQKPSSYESEQFLAFDIHNLIFGNLSDMIADERKIFREFGHVDFALYKDTRTKILRKMESYIRRTFHPTRFGEYLDWCENVNTPRIAVYPGSFNPMHRGHRDILHKAEKMFDKVIVLIGRNPAKPDSSLEDRAEQIRKQLPNNQVDVFDGLLHSHCKSLPYPVTIIKGLRNEDDFKNEKTQLRFMEDYDPDINVCYIIGDRAHEHVSSSAIRQINTFGPDTTQYR